MADENNYRWAVKYGAERHFGAVFGAWYEPSTQQPTLLLLHPRYSAYHQFRYHFTHHPHQLSS
jgi:hypothetical protein